MSETPTFKPPVYSDAPLKYSGEQRRSKLKEKLALMRKGLPGPEVAVFASDFNRDMCEPPFSNEEVIEILIESRELHEASVDEDERDAPINTRGEALLLLLQKKRRPMSFLEIREALNISKSNLSHIVKNAGDTFRTFNEGKQKYLTIRRGAGLVEDQTQGMDLEEEDFKIGCYLPGNFQDFIGGLRGGLKPKTFLAFCGLGDAGKTQFLINCAMWNAQHGKKVFFVQHEDDRATFWSLIAARILGHYPRSPQEVREALQGWSCLPNLRLFVAEGEVQLNEFLEDIRIHKPDIVCYDYLSQEYIQCDVAEQRSVISKIVNTIADELVAKGIPFLTAVQLSKGPKGFADLPRTWIRRNNVTLICEGVLEDQNTEGELCYRVRIEKNKQGGKSAGGRLLMYVDRKGFFITRVEPE